MYEPHFLYCKLTNFNFQNHILVPEQHEYAYIVEKDLKVPNE